MVGWRIALIALVLAVVGLYGIVAYSVSQGKLGLGFVADEPFALVFSLGPERGSDLRIVRVGAKHNPVNFTIFGWEVVNIEQVVEELTAKDIQFCRYSGMEQDERGIWHTPSRAKIAWFQDPDGNTLSIEDIA